MEHVAKKEPVTLTDRLRVIFKVVIDPIGAFLIKLGFSPNSITLLGVLGNVLAAYLLATGQITLGGIVVVIFGALDALDGTMARISGKVSKFGALLDSVCDRYSELLIFSGLLYYYMSLQDYQTGTLVFVAASGSVLVSYVKARAEGLGFDAKVGVLTRVERYAVLVPGLIFNIPKIALWIIALLANFTALQRLWHVRSQAERNNK